MRRYVREGRKGRNKKKCGGKEERKEGKLECEGVIEGKKKKRGNRKGGILGGISTGQDIVANIALKPTSSITVPGETITKQGEPTQLITKGRHDPCVGIRAVPIAEAMLAIVVMDHLLRHRGQNFNVTTETPKI